MCLRLQHTTDSQTQKRVAVGFLCPKMVSERGDRMKRNTAVQLQDSKWVSVPVPTTYHTDIPVGTEDQYCSENPKNTIMKLSDGSIWFFDHFGIPSQLDSDAQVAGIESL